MHRIILNTILVIIFLIMAGSLYRVLDTRYQEQSNIDKLKALVTSQQQQNSKLNSDYKYYTSNEYIEKVSRDDLNLAPSGEYIVVLPSGGTTGKSSNIGIKSPSSGKGNVSNWFDILVN